MDISIKIVIAVVIVLILVVAKIIYDEKKYIEKLTSRLKRTWGIPSRNEYTETVWKNIKYYFLHPPYISCSHPPEASKKHL